MSGTDTPTAGLDLTHLEGLVHFYFSKGLAPSTQRTYRAGQNRFLKFCQENDVSNPLPLSENLLCLFVAVLANQGFVAQDSKIIPTSTSFHADSGWPQRPFYTGSMAHQGNKESRGRKRSRKSDPATNHPVDSPKTAGSLVHFVEMLCI